MEQEGKKKEEKMLSSSSKIGGDGGGYLQIDLDTLNPPSSIFSEVAFCTAGTVNPKVQKNTNRILINIFVCEKINVNCFVFCFIVLCFYRFQLCWKVVVLKNGHMPELLLHI